MQGSVLAIAGLITRFIGMLYRIPLTNIIGSEGMTYYNTAYDIYNIALLVSTYSIPVALSKLVSSKDSAGEYINSNRLFRIGMIISGSIGLTVSLVLFTHAKTLAALMEWPSAWLPLRVLSPTIFVFSIMGIIRGFFQGKKNMVPTAVSQIIEQIFNAIFSIIAAVLLIKANTDTAMVAAYGAAGGTAGTLIGAFFGLIFLAFVYYINSGYFTRKCLKDHTGVRNTDSELAKILLLTMLPIIVSQTVYQLSGIIDNGMFAHIMEGKGYNETSRAVMYEAYSNKYKWLYNLPVAISTAFSVTIVPTLSGLHARNDTTAIKTKIASSVKLNMVIAIPSAVGLTVLSNPLLNMLFPKGNNDLAAELMTLGGIAVVFFSLSTFTNGVLQGINKLRLPVIHAAISLAVHIFIVWLLVSVLNFGVYGMVIGNCTYGLMVCILNWFAIERNLDYKQEIKTTFAIPLAASAGMGLSCWAVYKVIMLILKSNLIATVIAVLFGILIYFELMILFKGITEEELLGFPKGATVVRLARKLKLLK